MSSKIKCTRCDGSGIYAGFGVCYRCGGRKVVNATPARAPQAARVRGSVREEWDRSVALQGEADAALIALNGYGSVSEETKALAREVAERLGL